MEAVHNSTPCWYSSTFDPPGAMETKANIKKSFIGHKDRTFDLRYSSQRDQLLSASEDGTCRIWDAKTGKCSASIVHNKESEVLRACFLGVPEVGVCTGGSDGNVILWSVDKGSDGTSAEVKKLHVLQHGAEAQMYVCETPSHESTDLIVAAENFLVVWDLDSLQQSRVYNFQELAAGRGEVHGPGFGGHRNPENNVFVFDAKICPAQDQVIGVALSDSTIRMLDSRAPSSEAYSTIHLARQVDTATEKIGHATSLHWGPDANHMTVSLGSGQIAVLDMRMQRLRALLRRHDGACYGSVLVKDGNTCLSWSSDCTVKSWDIAVATGVCDTPRSIHRIADFPILSTAWDADQSALYCGGGGGAPGGAGATGKGGRGFSFIGTPIHLVSILA